MGTTIKKRLVPTAVTGLLGSILFGSCTQPTTLRPEPPATPARYELTNVRYFFDAGDRIDTMTIRLKGYSVQNPLSTPDSQQVENNLSELVKTSQFTLVRPANLPAGMELSTVAANVPAYWNGGESFTYFDQPFPLTSSPQQKPYIGFASKPIPVRIPPRAALDISRQIDAYQLTCSFEAVLENKTSGQRYPLTGKWNGLLRYNNVSITLTQRPLP